MACDRKRCEKIMCETYISSVGYICYECKDEFKDYLESTGKTDLREGELLRAIEEFMNTEKGHHKGGIMDVDSFFQKYTRE